MMVVIALFDLVIIESRGSANERRTDGGISAEVRCAKPFAVLETAADRSRPAGSRLVAVAARKQHRLSAGSSHTHDRCLRHNRLLLAGFHQRPRSESSSALAASPVPVHVA